MNFDKSAYDTWQNLKTKSPTGLDYENPWEKSVSTSYYYNPEENYNPPNYVPLCRFQGRWSDEVEFLKSNAIENNPKTASRKTYGGRHGGSRKDATGILPERFKNIADMFCLENKVVFFDLQVPGMTYRWHLDDFGGHLKEKREASQGVSEEDLDQRKIMRIIIFLKDQDEGQVWKQGNEFLTWKRGDCFTWPWKDIPHGTANFSHSARPTLNITGFVTDQTLEFLKECPKTISV
jgi:hypothetical protein